MSPAATVARVRDVVADDGTPLALHRWEPDGPARGLLYYVHGIQSHAGWLFETGPELASRGVAVYALDRRGSGLSGGVRGDMPSAAVLTGDYLLGLAEARRDRDGLPVTVLGQSFGAGIVAALAADGELPADRVVYCTPALGQQRARHHAQRLGELAALTGLEHTPIALDDEDYTDQARYLEFMANDPLLLRQVTQRSRATMVELEGAYLGRRAPYASEVHLVRTEHDPIIDLDAAAAVLRDLHNPVTTVVFGAHRHYVEFSPVRRDYWQWLGALAAGSRDGRDPA